MVELTRGRRRPCCCCGRRVIVFAGAEHGVSDASTLWWRRRKVRRKQPVHVLQHLHPDQHLHQASLALSLREATTPLKTPSYFMGSPVSRAECVCGWQDGLSSLFIVVTMWHDRCDVMWWRSALTLSQRILVQDGWKAPLTQDTELSVRKLDMEHDEVLFLTHSQESWRQETKWRHKMT